jgi:hypothetical protein
MKVAGQVNIATGDCPIGKDLWRPLDIALSINARLDVLEGDRVGLRLAELLVEGLLLENQLLDLFSSVLVVVLLLHHIHVDSLFSCVLKLLHEFNSVFLTGYYRVLLLEVLIHCLLDPLVEYSLSPLAYFVSLLWRPIKCHEGINPWGSRPHLISLIILNSLHSSLYKERSKR